MAQMKEVFMSYKITYEPLNRIAGVEPKTVTEETASSAWDLVDKLHRSDEKTTIRNSSGRVIGWQELRDLAVKEAN